MTNHHRIARYSLFVLVAVFILFGLSMLYSTSSALHGKRYLIRQVIFITIGTAAAFGVSFLNYSFICKYWKWLMAAIILVLSYLAFARVVHKLGVSVKFPFIKGETKGAYRWFRVGPLGIQPSEFAKIVLIIFLGNYYNKLSDLLRPCKWRDLFGLIKFWQKERWANFRQTEFGGQVAIPMVGFVLIAGLIFAGKSMSVTVITSAVAMAIFFVAGVRLRYLAAIGFLGLAGIGFIAINSPERVERFTTFRNPEVYKQTGGYQLWNGQLALGSGGMKGLGFTNSRMKNAYLPEAHTDFILAVVGEELGYLSLLFVALGYMLFLGLALYIAHHAKDTAGMIIASGVGFAITGHAFVNMGVISGFGPTTGVTAPFLSYGGSSMISALIAIGLLWSISRSSEKDFDEQNLKGSHATHLGH